MTLFELISALHEMVKELDLAEDVPINLYGGGEELGPLEDVGYCDGSIRLNCSVDTLLRQESYDQGYADGTADTRADLGL
jgi:hypothetical protein